MAARYEDWFRQAKRDPEHAQHPLDAGDFVHPHEGFSALTLGVGWGLDTDALLAIAQRMRHPMVRRQQITKAIEEAQRFGRRDVVERLLALLDG